MKVLFRRKQPKRRYVGANSEKIGILAADVSYRLYRKSSSYQICINQCQRDIPYSLLLSLDKNGVDKYRDKLLQLNRLKAEISTSEGLRYVYYNWFSRLWKTSGIAGNEDKYLLIIAIYPIL